MGCSSVQRKLIRRCFRNTQIKQYASWAILPKCTSWTKKTPLRVRSKLFSVAHEKAAWLRVASKHGTRLIAGWNWNWSINHAPPRLTNVGFPWSKEDFFHVKLLFRVTLPSASTNHKHRQASTSWLRLRTFCCLHGRLDKVGYSWDVVE